MSDTNNFSAAKTNEGANPIIAIAIAIAIATVLVVVTFTLFLKSSAYETVKDIQKNSQLSTENTGDYDTTSPVKAVDIEETMKTIQNQVNDFDNNADYGTEAVSTEALGI